MTKHSVIRCCETCAPLETKLMQNKKAPVHSSNKEVESIRRDLDRTISCEDIDGRLPLHERFIWKLIWEDSNRWKPDNGRMGNGTTSRETVEEDSSRRSNWWEKQEDKMKCNKTLIIHKVRDSKSTDTSERHSENMKVAKSLEAIDWNYSKFKNNRLRKMLNNPKGDQ